MGQRVVVRRRLLELLDRQGPLTLVRAPFGFGKTTLLRAWAETRGGIEVDVVPVTLSSPTSPAAFWGRVATALEPDAPADFSSVLAVQARLVARGEPVTLVLDRLDLALDAGIDADLAGGGDSVGDAAAGVDVAEQLLRLLDAVPSLGVVACVQGRLVPAPDQRDPTDVLLGAGQVVDARDLALSVDETVDLFRSAGLDRRPEQVAELHRTVGGWPFLLRLVAEALAEATGQVDDAELASRVTEEFVGRYLLAALAADEADRLCLLAVPGRLTVATAGLVLRLQVRETVPILQRLADLGLGTAQVEDGETALTWPPALRRALRSSLEHDAPERVRTLDLELTRRFIDRREHAPAIEHALATGDGDLVGHVLDRFWLPLLVYDNDVLAQVFREAPDEWFTGRAFLHGVRDLTLRLKGDPAARALLLPDDLDAVQRQAAAPDVRAVMNLGLVQLFGLRRECRFDDALALALRLQRLALAARVSSPGEVSDLLAPVFLLTATILELSGDHEAAIAPLRWGFETADVSVLRGSARHCSSHLAMDLALLGSIEESEVWRERAADTPVVSGWVSPRADLATDIARVLVGVDRLDRALAQEALRAVLSRSDPLDEMWTYALYARAQYALVWGDRAGVVQAVLSERASRPEWAAEGSGLDAIVRAAEVDLLLALGRRRQAVVALQTLTVPHPLLEAPRVRLALLSGRPAAALEMVRESLLERPSIPRARDDLALLEVVALLRTDDADLARERLERLLGEERPLSLRAWVMAPGEDLLELARTVPAAAPVLWRIERAGVRRVFPGTLEAVRLTGREQVILRHLAAGHSRDDIARMLSVSINTVKSQTNSIYRKLGAGSRAEALVRASEQGLLSISTGDAVPDRARLQG